MIPVSIVLVMTTLVAAAIAYLVRLRQPRALNCVAITHPDADHRRWIDLLAITHPDDDHAAGNAIFRVPHHGSADVVAWDENGQKIVLIEMKERRRTRPGAPCRMSSWFYTMTCFLPREIRCPALDHVLEDRERFAREGRAPWMIELITISQCIWLIILSVWWFVWDVLNPLKSRTTGDS